MGNRTKGRGHKQAVGKATRRAAARRRGAA